MSEQSNCLNAFSKFLVARCAVRDGEGKRSSLAGTGLLPCPEDAASLRQQQWDSWRESSVLTRSSKQMILQRLSLTQSFMF